MSIEALAQPITTISQYEALVTGLPWVYPLGTPDAQRHTRAKLDEETQEIDEALGAGNKQEFIEELGDGLWTATANGMNAGLDIASSLEYTFGERLQTLLELDSLAMDYIGDIFADNSLIGRLQQTSADLGKYASFWFRMGPQINVPAQDFADAISVVNRSKAMDSFAWFVVTTSCIAQFGLRKRTQDIIAINQAKLLQRVANGIPLPKPPRQ